MTKKLNPNITWVDTYSATPWYDLTMNQIAIMKHTISGHNRNYFIAETDSDRKDLDELVKLGLATERNVPLRTAKKTTYHLTTNGKKYIKKVLKEA